MPSVPDLQSLTKAISDRADVIESWAIMEGWEMSFQASTLSAGKSAGVAAMLMAKKNAKFVDAKTPNRKVDSSQGLWPPGRITNFQAENENKACLTIRFLHAPYPYAVVRVSDSSKERHAEGALLASGRRLWVRCLLLSARTGEVPESLSTKELRH